MLLCSVKASVFMVITFLQQNRTGGVIVSSAFVSDMTGVWWASLSDRAHVIGGARCSDSFTQLSHHNCDVTCASWCRQSFNHSKLDCWFQRVSMSWRIHDILNKTHISMSHNPTIRDGFTGIGKSYGYLSASGKTGIVRCLTKKATKITNRISETWH